MEQETFLQVEDRDRMVWVFESSLQIKNQSGFFLWSQGALQMLMPHEILICGVKNNGSRSFQVRRYSSCRYFRDEHFAAVCDPQDGLVARCVSQWLRTGEPCFVLPGTDVEIDKLLLDSELKNLILHGVWGADGDVCGYFCFSRTSLPRDPRSVRILEVLVPIIYVTFLRVLSGDARTDDDGLRVNNLVTRREVEILGWIKEGKTTADIAGILRLSPFTVKNHVQNILKKLGARSRSHAVAQAINLGLLHNGADLKRARLFAAVGTMAQTTYNVLFLCERNSARSIMAEALLNHLLVGKGRFKAYSAGSDPAGQVDAFALEQIRSAGLPSFGLECKSWDEFTGRDAPRMHFVFMVGDIAAPAPDWPGDPILARWSVPDPQAAGGDEFQKRRAFSQAFIFLHNRINIFASLPLGNLDRIGLQRRLDDIGVAQ